MSTVVFTGWYCTEAGTPRGYKVAGDDVIRGVAFRPLWWQSLSRFIGPDQVVVVDSASPVLPDDRSLYSGRLDYIRLPINPGHAQVTTHHYGGWMASVVLGLEYALLSDLDYFLYVEQDVLLFGSELKTQIESLLRKHRYVFGSGAGTPWPLQQSLFAIRRDGIRPFLSRLHALSLGDRFLSPELKFGIAACGSKPLSRVYDLLVEIPTEEWRTKSVRRTLKSFRDYAVLPFGYGRTRPIRFTDSCFYFQHASSDELEAYLARTGLSPVTVSPELVRDGDHQSAR